MANKRTSRNMSITEACLFIADMRERTWSFDGRTTGFPASITDNGDGTAIVISTREAFKEWDKKNEWSSPCVYWP